MESAKAIFSSTVIEDRLVHSPDDVFHSDFQDNRSRLGREFRESISSVLAYHACRPRDISAYQKDGIVPLDKEAVNDHARRVFGEMPGLTAELIEDAIKKVASPDDTDLRSGRIFLGLDERWLCDPCGHYLLYGSEYLAAIAVNIAHPSGKDVRQHLKTEGTPTMFVCDIPCELISNGDMEELASKLLARQLRPVTERESHFEFTIELGQVLPPDCIISHYCPKDIRDPWGV